jgi:glycosyltransferase involved in cell wall biosynthesis
MKDRPRVLFICPTVACYIGGTETVVSQISQRLKDKVRLTLLSGQSGEPKTPLIDTEGVELLTLPFIGRDTRLNHVLSKILMSSRFKIESYSFFRSLARSGIDLTAYDCIATFYEADAWLLARRYPALQGKAKHFLPGVSRRRFFRHVAAERVFFFGYRAAPKVQKRWGVRIESLPLGVDTVFFPGHRPAYPAVKRLIYIGRLDGSKHVDWLADFFAESSLVQRGYHLDIVGDGPLMPALLAKHGTTSGITFHGRKRQEEVVDILRQAHLLLHPSDHESFGLTILEAMAAGVPVITHELASVQAWAADHPHYARHLDRVSWAQEIAKFEQPAYWERVSADGLVHAKAFTWDRVAQRVLGLLVDEAGG